MRVSRKQAVEDKCKDCIYDPAIGLNWRKQVTMCSCTDCPLYPVRPLSSTPIAEVQLQFINAQCT